MPILTLQRSNHVPTFSHRNGEQLPDLRRGPKPRVQDVDMLTWMDAQEEASLSPFKGDHITEFLKRMGDSYAGSGERWWRNFKERNYATLSGRIPQLVETQRADAKLSEAQWLRFFEESVLPALDTVGGDPSLIWNMDESPFMMQYLANTGKRVWVRKGTKKATRKRGRCRTHVTLMGCVSAAGKPLIPALLWAGKSVKGDWYDLQACPIVCRSTGNGWSSSEVFMEWLKEVFVPNARPSENRFKKVLLFLDGSRTHLTVANLKQAKELGVEIVVFPPHMTDVIQPLDRGVFKPVKTFFHKLQHASIRNNENLGAHRLFVRNVTTAWVEAMKKETTIMNAWRACGLVPFNPDHFLSNCPSHRLRQPPAEPPTTPDPVPTVPTPPPSASQEELSSLGPSASQCAAVEKTSVGIQCTGRAINAAMKDDACNLRLGGFCTQQTFLDEADKREAEKKEVKPKKERQKKAKRKVSAPRRPAARRKKEPAPPPDPFDPASDSDDNDDPVDPPSDSDDNDDSDFVADDPFDRYCDVRLSDVDVFVSCMSS